jgi:hypothetical protein
MRVIGNEVWFDSTLVARLEPGIHCCDTVVEVLEDTADTSEEWQQGCEGAATIEELEQP